MRLFWVGGYLPTLKCFFCAVVVLSGDVASSLTAYLLSVTFDTNVVACCIREPTLKHWQLQNARFLAEYFGTGSFCWYFCLLCDTPSDKALSALSCRRMGWHLSWRIYVLQVFCYLSLTPLVSKYKLRAKEEAALRVCWRRLSRHQGCKAKLYFSMGCTATSHLSKQRAVPEYYQHIHCRVCPQRRSAGSLRCVVFCMLSYACELAEHHPVVCVCMCNGITVYIRQSCAVAVRLRGFLCWRRETCTVSTLRRLPWRTQYLTTLALGTVQSLHAGMAK